MLWIIVIVAVIALCYILLKRPHKFWIKRGVDQGNPVFIFGHLWATTIKKQTFVDMLKMVYNISSDSRYVGMYQFLLPTLVVKDPDLIKEITVKDFDHFVNHQRFVPEESDALWGKNLFALNDQKWRDMRTTLSPAFTTSKIKFMFSLVSESGEQFIQHFLKQNKDIITVEFKDTFTRFTNDVIANTAFGVKCDSLGDRDNEFYLMGKEATDFSGVVNNLKFFLYALCPWLHKILGLRVFSAAVSNFFTKLITENIISREKYGIVRPDMLHLLLEARKNGLKYEDPQNIQDTGFATVEESEMTKAPSTKQALTDIDITAQALIFFFAGFDTVSSLMCLMGYELGINPDIQDRLRKEIMETSEKCNGKPSYDAIVAMKYMDMVVSETLRLWPSSITTDRICTKPYTIQPKTPNEKPLHLEVDSVLWFPIFALHRDPNHFPDPERFDPERFNDENKGNIKPYTYLPFGAGPRNCIGSRFALMETKVLFYHILHNFEIVPVEKTKIPLKIKKASFDLSAEDGFWFGFKRLQK